MSKVVKEIAQKVKVNTFKKLNYEFEDVFKVLVIFVGKFQSIYSKDVNFRKYLKGEYYNFSLIIIGIGIEDESLIRQYQKLSQKTKEGYFINLKTAQEFESLSRRIMPSL